MMASNSNYSLESRSNLFRDVVDGSSIKGIFLYSSTEFLRIGLLGLVVVAFVSLSVPASAQFFGLLGPSDYEECADRAARETQDRNALNIRLETCHATFPARRKPGGGYQYCLVFQREVECIDVRSPKMSRQDWDQVDRRSAAIQAETRLRAFELERQQRETIQARQLARTNAATGVSLRRAEVRCERTDVISARCVSASLLIEIENVSRLNIKGLELNYLLPSEGVCPSGDLSGTSLSEFSIPARSARVFTLLSQPGAFGITGDLSEVMALYQQSLDRTRRLSPSPSEPSALSTLEAVSIDVGVLSVQASRAGPFDTSLSACVRLRRVWFEG
jgi:hypothetical protein